MRRILYLTHRIPFPPNKGDKIRSFNFLRHLARNNELYLATLVDEAADLAYTENLESIVSGLAFARIDSRWRKALALRGLATGQSITVLHFYSRALQTKIDELLDRVDFDAVVCSSSPTAAYIARSRHRGGKLAKLRRTMDLIDVDSFKWKQYAERSVGAIAWVYRHEADCLRQYEEEIYKNFHSVLFVSEQELSYFPLPDDAGKLKAVMNGVDLEYFAPRSSARDDGSKATIVFTGMMDYWPNIEGMRWFIDEVFPLVRQEISDATLYIVGGRPTAEVLGWASHPDIEVTGFVDDIRDYSEMADVCVAPLRVARGIQNKVLEAMAMAKPVVATPEALEGIGLETGTHALAAKGAKEFASVVIGVLHDRANAVELGRNARKFVESRCSWDSTLAKLEQLVFTSHDDPSSRP